MFASLFLAALAPLALAKDPVADLCPGLPFDQRPRVEVPRFEEQVSVYGNSEQALADKLNMALLTSGCFAVRPLGRTDVPFEARYRVQGSITEYRETSADSPLVINGSKVKVYSARLEFLLQVIDLESGSVLASEPFKLKAKSRKPRSGSVSEAMHNAIDKAVVEVTEFLAPYRTRMVVTPATPADRE